MIALMRTNTTPNARSGATNIRSIFIAARVTRELVRGNVEAPAEHGSADQRGRLFDEHREERLFEVGERVPLDTDTDPTRAVAGTEVARDAT